MSLLIAKAMARLLSVRLIKVALGKNYNLDHHCSSDPDHVRMMFYFMDI